EAIVLRFILRWYRTWNRLTSATGGADAPRSSSSERSAWRAGRVSRKMRRAMTVAIVAEKPSVARDIAHVLGANARGDGFLHGNGHVVTWAIGHLVGLAQPHEIDPAWKRWDARQLPMLPPAWPLVVLDSTKSQFEIVRRIINGRSIERVVCATDAGREGE